MSRIAGRADTPEGKRLVVERILSAWMRMPEQRLGQLLVNSGPDDDMFYVEDFAVAEGAANYASRFGKKETGT